jgi:hypothetical protein
MINDLDHVSASSLEFKSVCVNRSKESTNRSRVRGNRLLFHDKKREPFQ